MNGKPDRKICIGRVETTITEPLMITGGLEVDTNTGSSTGVLGSGDGSMAYTIHVTVD